MLLLVHAAPTTLEPHRRPNLGVLSSPDRWYRDVDGWPWAADNGAFGEFSAAAYVRMLDGMAELESLPLFVTLPDVVGDADSTTSLWWGWIDDLLGRELPLAYVAQDGLEPGDARVPWEDMAALFIGGTTAYKMSADAAQLAGEARARGKHVHWGRVSSLRRKRYIASVGGEHDSIDGNINNRWRDVYLDRNVAAAAAPAQGRLVP